MDSSVFVNVVSTSMCQGLAKIVSGGQTGADRAGLDVALELGIARGGWCPAGRRASDGRIPDHYPLTETAARNYNRRTAWNIRDSDATLILNTGRVSGGIELTAKLASRLDRPCLIVDLDEPPRDDVLAEWLRAHAVRVLNVAGPSEDKRPGIHARVRADIWQARYRLSAAPEGGAMLILTRHYDEDILIGDDIRVRVAREPNPKSVRLMIDAPQSVDIWREELAKGPDACDPDETPEPKE